MNLIINGKKISIDEDEVFISKVLVNLNITKPVIVEVNGKIISKDNFGNLKLKDNDVLEILYFMGGG